MRLATFAFCCALILAPFSVGATVILKQGDVLYFTDGIHNVGLYRLDTVTGHRLLISGCPKGAIANDCAPGGSALVGSGPLWNGCPSSCHASALPNGSIVVIAGVVSGQGINAPAVFIVSPNGDRTVIAEQFDGNGGPLGSNLQGEWNVVAFPIQVAAIGPWGLLGLCAGVLLGYNVRSIRRGRQSIP
jgi:hypothetical protein